MAIDSMRKAYSRDEVRELIEAREKAERDEVSRHYQARREGKEEGIELGLEQGIELGIERGKELGLEEGIERGKEHGKVEAIRAMARRLLETRMPKKQIAEITGLSEEEITQL